MIIRILANGQNITEEIRPGEFMLEENVTSKVDAMTFAYRKYGDRTYFPEVGHVVSLEIDQEQGAGFIKEFEGSIVQINESVEGVDKLVFRVTVKDYLHQLDQILIAETYENKTIKYIVDDFIANWFTKSNITITGNNVSAEAENFTIEFVQFDYSRPTDALTDLAEFIQFDFWIDANKDLHFIPKGADTSPFDLNDQNASYEYRSLKLKRSDKQLRNTIYVEGSEFVGNTLADKVDEGDGIQKTFNLPYRYDKLPAVTVGGVGQTVGVAYLDQPQDFDCLWSQGEKIIFFETAPASGDIVVTGDPLIPLFVKLTSPGSVEDKGSFEFRIVDKTLKSEDAVRKRAAAEISAYAETISEGSFKTNRFGLRSGQRLSVNSAIRGINRQYVIQRVVWKLRTPTSFTFEINLANVKAYEIIEFFKQLLRTGDKTVGFRRDSSSVLNLISSLSDPISTQENITINQYRKPLQETSEASDSLLRVVKDDPPTWVYGPYKPTGPADRKRAPKISRGAFYQS